MPGSEEITKAFAELNEDLALQLVKDAIDADAQYAVTLARGWLVPAQA